MIGLLDSYKAGLFNLKNIKTNILAGIVVGVVAIPLAMAFAIASGAKPEQGIYTAIIAGLVTGIFGGTRTQISGPTGAFVVILAAITAKYGFVGLQVATFLAGILLCLLGLFKLGNIIKFISYPIIVGFTSGIGVLIFVGQWKDFFGLRVNIPIDTPFSQKIIILLSSIQYFDLTTTMISSLSLLMLVLGTRFIKNIPPSLLVLVIVTAVQAYFSFSTVTTIGSVFGAIPQTLPKFSIPSLEQLHLVELIIPAITIALLGAIESLLSAAAADSICGTKHDSNQELIGQGLANLTAPLFGGFASTGAIARTVTNIKNGGNCILASIIHSIFLLSILLFFAPYASYIPLAILSAILFVVAYNMSNFPEFFSILKKAPLYDRVTLTITFLLTIFTNLVVAVAIGVVFSILFFMLRKKQTAELHKKRLIPFNLKKIPQYETFISDGIICTIDGPFYFGVTAIIEHSLAITNTLPKFVIFRFCNIPFIDMSGIITLIRIIEQYKKKSVKVYICEANHIIYNKLLRNNVTKTIEGKRIFDSVKLVAEHYFSQNVKN